MPLLEAVGLHLALPDRAASPLFGRVPLTPILKGIDLAVEPGESLGIVGESGSGKTSLGRTLLRLYEPTGGTLRFEGHDIAHLPVVGEALKAARMSSLDVPPPRLRHETLRRVINAMVTDLLAETNRLLAKLDPKDPDAIRRSRHRVVAFSPPMAEANQAIKDFLFARMYRHWRVNRMSTKARRLTEELFRLLHADPTLLPDDWRARAGEAGSQRAATIVGDYVAAGTG